ncbi:MAG: 4a-hydroxytetrahydrobiopterin dehydratase [Acidobacteria bacterium]|jgi:4a-hydroxytetrahydrobiopterin dehydratase|nr:4a-hydroxytetrahydrobiopterin dehydratase [Acidobacteriota bacterium]
MDPLSDSEVAAHLRRLPEWERHGSAIRRTFSFADFEGAMAFVNRVAALAEAADHHPDIDIRYSKVTLTLSTHDAGGLTDRDFALAGKIET